ncbi:MAG: response regulator [Nitrosarchaeum sp.]|nr:response regulator [Nitrosarchaeum sp.]
MIRVIVVDDDFDTAEVFSEYLMLNNIDVVGKAYNGFEGIKLFEEKKPDIVFSDIWMPKFDGFYLLDNLKSLYPNQKIIMITADLSQETYVKLKESKADALIFKPFRIKQILETINKISEKDSGLVTMVNK